MTVHEIYGEVQLPEFARNLSLEELDSAIEQFPYAGTLFIAKAIKLHDLQDIQFLDALPKAAARTISRSHLKQLIEGPIELSFDWMPKSETKEIEQETNPEEPEPVIAEAVDLDGPASEPTAIVDPLEEPIEVLEPVDRIIETPKLNAFGFSFVKIKPGKKKPATPEPFDIQNVATTRPLKSRKTQDSVIEKFLENSPSISSPRIDFGGPSKQPDLSVRSTSLNEDIVTENMALIYLKQRNFEKALEIYRRLQLKFPEKSAFFAALIKNIENTIV